MVPGFAPEVDERTPEVKVPLSELVAKNLPEPAHTLIEVQLKIS